MDSSPEVITLKRKWSIGKAIGEGGFARVYQAEADDGTPAAVKVIPKAPGSERELLFEDIGRFPNVVPVLDKGEWNGYWVIVMPMAEKSLRTHLNQHDDGRLPVNDALEVLTDVIETLAAIKEGGVVHRDIKPDNILFLDGKWCLADFGISRYAEASTSMNTRKNAWTRQYAAPEQWQLQRVTSATDVYAFGVLAYEILTGRLPFRGPEEADYKQQHLFEAPDSIEDVPEKLSGMVSQCLLKLPETRPTPANLKQRLREGLEPSSSASLLLQQAQRKAVDKEAEAQTLVSVRQSENAHILGLYKVAVTSLRDIADSLMQQILRDAPLSKVTFDAEYLLHAKLNEATLIIARSRMVDVDELRSLQNKYRMEHFSILGYSRIIVEDPPMQRTPYQHAGLSNSLWYCDVEERETFRWYSTSFEVMSIMPEEKYHPYISSKGRINPFALDPGKNAFQAMRSGLDAYVVAHDLKPIDHEQKDRFLETWVGLFALAAS